MKAGIIAAGTGERLARSGISTPKPLVPVSGRPLIARIIDAASRLGVTSVACVVNDLNPAVAGFLRSGSWPVPLELVVRTTASSMESLFSLEHLLRDEPFVLFTVDVVMSSKALEAFARDIPLFADAKGILALTEYIDDEKPLWAAKDDRGRITALGDAAKGGRYITAGFYYFTPDVFEMVDEAHRRGLGALRQLLGLFLDKGFPLYGIPVSKTIDVDYPQDIEKAEAFLKEIGEP